MEKNHLPITPMVMQTAPERLEPSGNTKYLRFRDNILSVVPNSVSLDELAVAELERTITAQNNHQMVFMV